MAASDLWGKHGRLTPWRERAKLSLREAADLIGMSHYRLRECELGRISPTIGEGFRMAEVYGVSIRVFLGPALARRIGSSGGGGERLTSKRTIAPPRLP